jgi:hypothetical protein
MSISGNDSVVGLMSPVGSAGTLDEEHSNFGVDYGSDYDSDDDLTLMEMAQRANRSHNEGSTTPDRESLMSTPIGEPEEGWAETPPPAIQPLPALPPLPGSLDTTLSYHSPDLQDLGVPPMVPPPLVRQRRVQHGNINAIPRTSFLFDDDSDTDEGLFALTPERLEPDEFNGIQYSQVTDPIHLHDYDSDDDIITPDGLNHENLGDVFELPDFTQDSQDTQNPQHGQGRKYKRKKLRKKNRNTRKRKVSRKSLRKHKNTRKRKLSRKPSRKHKSTRKRKVSRKSSRKNRNTRKRKVSRKSSRKHKSTRKRKRKVSRKSSRKNRRTKRKRMIKK